MADLVTLTIDGVEVTVPKGTYVVDAAKRIDNHIPVFCYHPKMEPVGMCRMCLVEIGTPMRDRQTGEPLLNDDGTPQINFGRGMQTGCTVPVSEGMVVRTRTEAVIDARDDILEFLLTSHPLDCPICDKGGECPLQNLTMRHGPGVSRMDFTNKKRLGKRVPLGQLIVLDRERCIQCARCTRFQAEIVDDPVIAFHERGRSLQIVTNSVPGFDSIWSGNTTDICPVGALTTTDFRFQARPWELTSVASVCTHCPVGCNTTLSTRREARSGGRQVIKRVMPRQNEMVNEIWMCDKGRFVHHYADAPDRLTQPLVRQNGELVPATWDEALALAAQKLQAHKDSLAGLSGDRLSNEDLFIFQRLLRDGLGSPHIDQAQAKLGGAEVVAKVGLAKGSNLLGLGQGDAILVVASDLHQEAPVWWLRLKQATERGAQLIVLNARPTRLDRYAAHILPYAPGEGLALAHRLLNAARVAAGGGEDDPLQAAAAALMQAQHLVAFYGGEGLTYDETEQLARILGNLLLLKNEAGQNHVGRANNGLVPVWPHNNTQGAWDMGIRPDAGPGYTPLAQSGMGAAEIFSAAATGSLQALYIMGADPVGDGLMDGRGQLDFLVVQELFLTETAQLADVVLPARSWAEREGTFTNGERRVQRFYPAIPTIGVSLSDWQIVARIEELLGLGKAPFAAGLVFRDIAEAVPHYEGMSYRSLSQVVEQWPHVGGSDMYYGGTAYDNKSGVGQQWPAAAEGEGSDIDLFDVSPGAAQASPVPLEEGQFLALATTALYRSGTLVDHSAVISSRVVPPSVLLHPSDAVAAGVEEGDVLTLESAGQQVQLAAVVGDDDTAVRRMALLRGVVLANGRAPVRIAGVQKAAGEAQAEPALAG